MEAVQPEPDALQVAHRSLSDTPPGSVCTVAAGFRDEIGAFLERHGPIALTRACLPGHLTASCLLWNAAGTRVLLHHHRKLNLWLQFGGHCDGDGDTRRVATRETTEESGIEPAFVTEHPVDFDIHTIPARPAKADRPAEPEHLHLDVRYLAFAPDGAVEEISDESIALAWFTPDEAKAKGLDPSLLRMLELGPPSRH
jgi:8-oxo-dGTP pyrophosphatase MutT (NUDIX family)